MTVNSVQGRSRADWTPSDPSPPETAVKAGSTPKPMSKRTHALLAARDAGGWPGGHRDSCAGLVLGGDPGHKVAVYSKESLPAGSPPPSFPGRAPVSAAFMLGGKVHVFEVDSSWGASGQAARGGVKREVWLYNESTKVWAYFDGSGAFKESKKGAYDHSIVGLYGGKVR